MFRTTLWSLGIFAFGALGASVRIFPLVLADGVPASVSQVFLRALLVLAAEVALVVGIPVGAAAGASYFVERGEAQIYELCGESPARSARRLAWVGLVLACALGGGSQLGGRDARAPGEVAQALVDRAASACRDAGERTVHRVPLVGVHFLCEPGQPPKLYGKSPGGGDGARYLASSLALDPDLRGAQLSEVELHAGPVVVRVHDLRFRGLRAWARASNVPAWLRATTLGLGAAACFFGIVFAVFRARLGSRIPALATAASGPLVGLAALRGLERAEAPAAFYLLLPGLMVAALVGSTWLHVRVRDWVTRVKLRTLG